MANEIHGTKNFPAAAAVEIDFGVEEGVGYDILVTSYAIWGTNQFHIAHDEDATTGHHLLPANTYVSHAIPCRKLSIIGGGGATGTVYWIAIPMHPGMMSDQESFTRRGGVNL